MDNLIDNNGFDLTKREIEILKYIADGKSSKLIGSTLFISKETVDKHRKNMLKKTGFRNSMELVQSYLRNVDKINPTNLNTSFPFLLR